MTLQGEKKRERRPAPKWLLAVIVGVAVAVLVFVLVTTLVSGQSFL